MALVNPWATRRVDPNNYYGVLQLDKNQPWLQWQVKEAYRKAVRSAHPDHHESNARFTTEYRGSSVSLFELVVQAGKVLLNPQTRRLYDLREEGDPWFDRFVAEKMLADYRLKVSSSAGDARCLINNCETAVASEMDSQDLAEVDSFKGQPNDYQYYWEEGCEVPSKETRDLWFSELAWALWQKGYVTDVRVGFTNSWHRVERKPWGCVYMVPTGITPTRLVAMWLVHEADKHRSENQS